MGGSSSLPPLAAASGLRTADHVTVDTRRIRTARADTPPVEPPEGAFIIVNGRRWRASDPHIPAGFRQELVNELMAARRAVRDAEDDAALRRCRRRVHDAKVALGERGRAWWLPPTPVSMTTRIDAALLALLRSRGPDRSICPSDVARIIGGPSWRARLPAVRACAVSLRDKGELDILRGGQLLTRNLTEGVLRYRLARSRDTA